MEADADAVGEDPALAELAEQQRKAALALLAQVDNLDSALVKLGEADFYGLAALEVCGSLETRMRWEVIEPWHLYQPLPNGPVFYNEQADTIPQRAEELERESVIIRTAPAMHLPVMFLISRMSHSEEQWDAFIDTYGLPNIFFELPAAMDERRALELDAIVKRLTGDGRGTMPNGTKIQTVETQQRDGTLFEQRGKWCRDAIISLVLGGTLTMETAPNSGTLAGNAHADSFAELCEGSAAGIGAAVDEQFLRPLLRKVFPNQPILVSFEFRPVDAEDAQQVAQTLATLKTAGWQVSPETASEMLGFEVEAAPAAAEAPAWQARPFGNTAPAAGVVTNAAENPTDEAPLTKDELDALALVQNAMDPDVLRKKAAAIAGTLYGAMQTVRQSETLVNKKKDDRKCHDNTCSKHGKNGKPRKVKAKVATAKANAISRINANMNKDFTHEASGVTARITSDIREEMKRWPGKYGKELLHNLGLSHADAEAAYYDVCSRADELFTQSTRYQDEELHDSVEAQIKKGRNEVKEHVRHYFAPVDIPGIEKPLEADISVIRFKGQDIPRIYCLKLQEKEAPAG